MNRETLSAEVGSDSDSLPERLIAFVLSFHSVERAIGRIHQGLHRIPVPRANGETCTQGDVRLLAVVSDAIADTGQDLLRPLLRRFRQYHRKFIASLTSTGVNSAGAGAEHCRGAAQCPRSNLVSELVVDLLETIQIKQKEGKRPPGAARSLYFHFQGLDEAPVVGEAGDAIGHRQAMDIAE
jgi:hypothetical protein